MERYLETLDETDCFGTRIGLLLKDENHKTVNYCKSLVDVTFYGETSNHRHSKHTDVSNSIEKYNLGLFLKLLHFYITTFKNPLELTEDESMVTLLLKLIALKRRKYDENNTQAFNRLMKDKNRFIKFYQNTKVHSKCIKEDSYWGTRQQLRAGKVIADFIDPVYGPLDPIFGVLLCPCAGRTGAGDSRVVQGLLFDHSGPVAYHSAVHDAFGYLRKKHNIGPGYSYLESSVLSSTNPLAGQVFGQLFWRVLLTKK